MKDNLFSPNIDISIETRVHSGKEQECYIPKINGVPVLDNGYILKISIDQNGNVKDNIDLAKWYITNKISEINSFMKNNSKFI